MLCFVYFTTIKKKYIGDNWKKLIVMIVTQLCEYTKMWMY